jgi:hypothetical protein
MSSTGLARSGNLAATDRELSKLKELRAMLEKANQSYWAEQVETQMLTASAWIAHAKGQEDEALKFMRAAADVEDNSEKHVAMLAQHYDCAGFGGRDRGRWGHFGYFFLT